ncbi:hypothetical protein [Yoonia sediminilitoris]|uniref:Uncharacterized protein n=1 Tax=Yoonia sediminilitoris TaxID=1286148 RepID=A0A2T6KFP2_9RHOB|nr:hypothetical protein [Yoonia sediminilitoris]PUB14143.1 hypothetical protein C8N45_10616 [Yoonia sediminilitoris]RCW95074.1 hypothetical protein DFP92_10616 [Yoonia sediminilitoris]
MTQADLQSDHMKLEDTRVTRRYFGKFAKITQHLTKVAATMQAEGRFDRREIEILARYLTGLNWTFRAMAHKYHFAGRYAHAGALTFDRVESGFPVYQELLEMANDAQQADRHLATQPSVAALKDEMVRVILGEQEIPTKLQYALSQRLYYEELAKGDLFWARNDPQAVWLRNADDRRMFQVHWAVYDSQVNLPTIYLMDVADTGRTGLPKDEARWPQAQAHLMAQSVAGLKLLTIARGFDEDFDDLHPTRLRRFHIGPMYSNAFTRQSGPLRDVLRAANAPAGDDWALVWTEEDLVSERVENVKSGWFGSVERQIFALDPFAGGGGDTGASRMERALIMPERPYQALAERNPPGFHDVRKFVVNDGGRVLSYR